MNKDTDNSKISLHKYIFGENLNIDNSRPISEGNTSWGYAINRMTDSIRAHHTKILPNKMSITRSEYLYKHWYSNDLDINIDLIFKRYLRNRWTGIAKEATHYGIKVDEDLEKYKSPSGRYIAGVDAYHSRSNQGEGIIIRNSRIQAIENDDKIVAEYFSRPEFDSNIAKLYDPKLLKELLDFKSSIMSLKTKEQPIDKYKAIILEQLLTNSVSINMKFNHDSSIRIYNNNIDMTLMQPDVVDAVKQLLIKTLK